MDILVPKDALTRLLERVHIDAKLHQHRDYCGRWAIDTSCTGLIPFHLIDKGSGWLHVKGQSPQLLQPGDFVLFPRDVPHQISNDSTPPEPGLVNTEPSGEKDGTFASILCGFYTFRSRAVQPLLDDLPGIVLIMDARNNPSTPGIGCVIDAAMLELQHNSPGRSAALQDLARLLFLHVMRDQITRGLSQHFLAALWDPNIGKALNVIHSEFGKALNLQTLARAAGLSRSAFSSKFHVMVGTTPAKYLTDWRMQEASMLLETTDMSVEQISERCGYGSHIAFRKAFKTNMGFTPKRARMGSKEQED